MNCRNCAYSAPALGSSRHLHCRFAETHAPAKTLTLAEVARMATGKNVVAEAMNLTLNPHGVKNGWAEFPWNYDPIWVEGECRYYSKKGVAP
jgi:hypothetical protein